MKTTPWGSVFFWWWITTIVGTVLFTLVLGWELRTLLLSFVIVGVLVLPVWTLFFWGMDE